MCSSMVQTILIYLLDWTWMRRHWDVWDGSDNIGEASMATWRGWLKREVVSDIVGKTLTLLVVANLEDVNLGLCSSTLLENEKIQKKWKLYYDRIKKRKKSLLCNVCNTNFEIENE